MAASLRMGSAFPFELCLGARTGMKDDSLPPYPEMWDIDLYMGAAGTTVAGCLFRSSTKFGFNLTLGESRGAESDLVSQRSFSPGGFANLFLTTEEEETGISFEADIERSSRVSELVSLAGLLETDSLPNTDGMLLSDSISLSTVPFKCDPAQLSAYGSCF